MQGTYLHITTAPTLLGVGKAILQHYTNGIIAFLSCKTQQLQKLLNGS